MRVTGTIHSTDNLCDYCQLEFATCPKANHIQFGNGTGKDNVIECSEYVLKNWHHNFPIIGKPELGIIPAAS